MIIRAIGGAGPHQPKKESGMERKQKNSKNFTPDWIEEPPGPGSFRSVFKWGAPDAFKHPNKRLFRLMKETFNLTDDDFSQRQKEGNEAVRCDRRINISKNTIAALRKIAGNENVSTDDYSRVKFSFGKTVEEATKLRNGIVERAADVVVHPRDKEDVRRIVAYCNKNRIPIYVYGGGSSVNFGFRPSMGGIALVMNTHMNKLIELNEANQTARVQPGLMGPAYEDILNNAPEKLGAARRYTCGHFPQSFEHSSVGGWVATLGSGQASSYYGDAYDLVISQEYVTPAGTIKTLDYPATATGPKVNDILKGSEGSFGICVELTMKVFRYMPKNQQRYSFIFPTWEQAINACREVAQGEFGMPAVFRISDPEETDVALKLYGIEGTVIDLFMKLRGYKKMERCLLLGTAEGEKSFAKNIKRQIRKICRKYGGMYITGYPVSQWQHSRYTDPYMREDLQDYGVIIDTLESGVTWDNIHRLHRGVREFVKGRPQTVCMTHASHFYPQGTNLYFIFIAKMKDVKEYIRFQEGIIDSINRHGGSLSHHHGVGKMIAPWMEKHLGKEQMAVLRTLKRHFDPKNIMNPGGQLGLDLKGSDWRKIK
jgi:alkyldihydroxyacetonephosphate synthase